MTALLSVLLSMIALSRGPVPEGAQLHIRLTSAVGSYASTPGSAVNAVLIAPVTANGETIVPAGSTLTGQVKSVTRVGLGLRHETAALDLDFYRITPPAGQPIPLFAQVSDVDNGRERVTADGRIHGVRSTGSMCYRVSGYIRTMLGWEIHAELAEWAIRSLIMEIPEPEIYYPPGVELTLTLTQPLSVGAPLQPLDPVAPALADVRRQELEQIVAAMPDRTAAPPVTGRHPSSGRDADLTNVLLIGTHDQIVDAFEASGWTQAGPSSLRDRIHWIRAAAELRGDEDAPMSLLLLDGAGPDMYWQKGLNDVAKRHHIRLWKADRTWRGREIWIGAATRDVDFAYLRPGRKLAHKIDEAVDQERDKVAYDLAFSTCGNILDWIGRPDLPQFTHNATGDPIVTDGRMVTVELNDCRSPRVSTETVDSTSIPAHGDRLQRLVRREILGGRNDLLRSNPYWRTFEACRWIVEYLHGRRMEAKRVHPDAEEAGAGIVARRL